MITSAKCKTLKLHNIPVTTEIVNKYVEVLYTNRWSFFFKIAVMSVLHINFLEVIRKIARQTY
jgi:hypothetical protein